MRYARAGGSEENLELLESCLDELCKGLYYKVCYTELSVNVLENCVKIGETVCHSSGLAKNLQGCRRAVIFAASIGLFPDRCIKKYGSLSPSRALIIDAIGSERVESLCDVFCEDMKKEAERRGESLRPRFSPGYGDLSLNAQKDIFALLDPPKNIGVTLSESLLMMPSKSVTAIAGIC